MTDELFQSCRRSIRLPDFDYASFGLYYVTICTQNHSCLFGDVENAQVNLNDAGNMIRKAFIEIQDFYNNIHVDEFIVMPNHFHGIVAVSPEPIGGREGQARGPAPTKEGGNTKLSLIDIVTRFKSLTTKRYIDGVKTKGWVAFERKLWQRNYYEHVIRNDNDLNHIRDYIQKNPFNWSEEKGNPENLFL